MGDDAGSIQNEFFNQARKERRAVTIFLISGKRLTGRIKGFDKFTLMLDAPQGELMLFKHAIASVAATADGEAWAHADDETVLRDDALDRSDRPAAGKS